MFARARDFLIRFRHEKDEVRDRQALVRITAAIFLVTLALTWRVYIPDHRLFALSPLLDFLKMIPVGVDWALFAVNVGCLGWLLVKPLHRAAAAGVLACTVFWVLQDYMRLQPYTYMYFFTILFAVFFNSSGLNATRILIAGVYFWAGIHKLNVTFIVKIFPWFIQPVYSFPEHFSFIGLIAAVMDAGTPLFEAAIGVLLVFPRRRRLATFMAFIMLAVVLLCLGPFGHNQFPVVWPWNIYLFFAELVLFCTPMVERLKPRDGLGTVSLALFVLAPSLAFFGWWPSYAALKLFSGNTELAFIRFAPDEDLTQLPENLARFVTADRSLSPLDWTVSELTMSVNPEAYVFREGPKGLCPYLKDPQHAVLQIASPPPFYSLQRKLEDYPLCP